MIFYDLAALCREMGQAEAELGSVEWAGEFDPEPRRASKRANHLRWAASNIQHAAKYAAGLRPLVSADPTIEREVAAYDRAVAKLAALRAQYPDAAQFEADEASAMAARVAAAAVPS